MDQQICLDTGHPKWIFFPKWTWFCTFFVHRNPWLWWVDSSKVYVSELKSTQKTIFFQWTLFVWCFLTLCITFCETCKMQLVAITTMCLLFSFPLLNWTLQTDVCFLCNCKCARLKSIFILNALFRDFHLEQEDCNSYAVHNEHCCIIRVILLKVMFCNLDFSESSANLKGSVPIQYI